MLRNPYFFKKKIRRNISHNPPRKRCAMKLSQLKKHVPHLKFCILFYKIYRKGSRLYMYVSMCFKIMSKVVNIYMRPGATKGTLRRENENSFFDVKSI